MAATTADKVRLTMAEQADRHALYQESVQNAEFELDFIDQTFKELVGRKPRSMREDFAGTGLSSVEWVKRRKTNTALAIDNDPEVLAWGRKHNLTQLNNEQKKRVEFIESDVRTVQTGKFDVVQAYNFSYWFFQERRMLVNYFKSVK